MKISTDEAGRLLDTLTPEETRGLLMRLLGAAPSDFADCLRDVIMVRAKQQVPQRRMCEPRGPRHAPADTSDTYAAWEYRREQADYDEVSA